MPPITAPIHPRMQGLVMALRDAGFKTVSSAFGDEHDYLRPGIPSVEMYGNSLEDALALNNWCVDQDIAAVVSLCWSTIATERTEWMRLEVFDTLRESYS